MQQALPVPSNRLARLSLAASVALRVQRTKGTDLAVQAFRMVWGAGNGGGLGTTTAYAETFGRYGQLGTLPGSSVDYVREVGDPCHNAVVSIAVNWIKNQLAEPQFQVTRKRRDGSEEAILTHPLVKLLDAPNPDYDGQALLAGAAGDFKTAGNAFWLKSRGSGGAGSPVQLWYVPYWEIAPQWPADGSQFITQYIYRPGGRGQGMPVARENVVHFRADLNPYNQGRTGRQPLFPLLREIYQDNESAEYEAAITANMGIVGGMLTAEGAEGEIPKAARDELVDLWVDKFTGSNRGSVLVASHAVKYTKIGQSPAELGIAALRDRPEDRICAALGVPPMVLGLTSGAASKSYANYAEARTAAYDDCILPLLSAFARTLNLQLLPDFESSERVRCSWDLSQVKALSEDQTEVYTRVNSAVAAGWLRVDQARRLAGVEEDDEAAEARCRVFLLPSKSKPVADLTDAVSGAHDEAASGYQQGLLTRNEAREKIGMPPVAEEEEPTESAAEEPVEQP